MIASILLTMAIIQEPDETILSGVLDLPIPAGVERVASRTSAHSASGQGAMSAPLGEAIRVPTSEVADILKSQISHVRDTGWVVMQANETGFNARLSGNSPTCWALLLVGGSPSEETTTISYTYVVPPNCEMRPSQ